MKKIYIFLGCIILVSMMGLMNERQSKNRGEQTSQNASPELKTTVSGELPGFYSSASNDYKEFASPDGKLRIKYPASWLVVDNRGLGNATIPSEWRDKYNLATIFLAQNFKENKFAQLMIQEGVFDIAPQEIIEDMKRINKEQALDMEIVNSDIQNDKATFEARYLMSGSPTIYSQEKILVIGEKTYLIAFITLEKDWQEFAQEADVILESAEVAP